MSNGASLTPPTRVENAAAYGPGASHRRSGRSLTDQVPRRRQLGLAPIELASELPAAELGQDLPHPRRLGEAELREVVAVDVEADAAESREVRAQRREVGDREGEERRVRRAGVGERDDGRRVRLARETLDELRREGDRADDVPHVVAAEAEAVQQALQLARRDVEGEDGEADSPGRRVDAELSAQRIGARGQPGRLGPAGKRRVDRAVDAEPGKPLEGGLDLDPRRAK